VTTRPGGGAVAVVLAAGAGVRFSGPTPKPLAEWRGRPLLDWSLAAARTSNVGPVAVVVGARAGEIAAIAPDDVAVVVNDGWASGIGSSVAAAVRWAMEIGAGRTVIALADQPRIGADAWRRVAAAAGDLVVATYAGQRGHPVAIGARHFDAALGFDGDEGARVLMRVHPVVEVPCDGTGEPDDIDTVADLERLGSDSVR